MNSRSDWYSCFLHSSFLQGLTICVVVWMLLPFVALLFPESNPISASNTLLGTSSDAPLGQIHWTLFGMSLLVGAAATCLAVLIGTLIAFLLYATDFPQATLCSSLLLIPFVCPPTVWAISQVSCFGPSGLVEQFLGDDLRPWLNQLNRDQYLSTTLILAQVHVPLVLLLVGRGFSRMPAMGLDAARLYLKPLGVFRWTLRVVMSEVCAASLLVFVLSISNFAIPQVTQCRLYPVEIYLRMTNYLDPVGASFLSLPLLSVTLMATLCFLWLDSASPLNSQTDQSMALFELGKWKYLYGCLLFVYLLITCLLPIFALVYQCGSLTQFLSAISAAAPETENSIWVALLTATVATGIGLLMISVSQLKLKQLLQIAAMLPLGIPAFVIGLAYVGFYNRTSPISFIWIADSIWLVVLGLSFRFLPFVYRILLVGKEQFSSQWKDASVVSNLSLFSRLRWIRLPLMFHHLTASFVIGFVLAFGEIELSQMLTVPGHGTLTMRLFTFMHFGPTHVVASLALLQLLLALLPISIYFLISNRCPQII